MKMRIVALSCLTGVLVAFATGVAGGGRAGAPTPGVQIGVVGMVYLLDALSNEKAYVEEVVADARTTRGELDTLAKQVENEGAELATLKPASKDYLKQLEAVAESKARFNARKDYFERRSLLRKHLWTQKSYDRIARATREVAAEKGLALVLVKDDPNLATPTLLATQRVPYWGSCPDITPDVQAKLLIAKPPATD
jgi:Skp family chaperone for outer membrane proteins